MIVLEVIAQAVGVALGLLFIATTLLFLVKKVVDKW